MFHFLFLLLTFSAHAGWENPVDLSTAENQLKTQLGNAGFKTEDGTVLYITPENCKEILGDCSGLNEGSVYGGSVFKDWDWLSPIPSLRFNGWPFESHQAVIQFGLTPPKSVYYSYTPYVVHKRTHPRFKISKVWDYLFYAYLYFKEGPALTLGAPEKDLVFASLGDSLNPIDVETQTGRDPFASPFALVAASNEEVLSRVVPTLKSIGLQESDIFIQVIPERIGDLKFKFGHGPNHDDFTLVSRIAFPEKQEDLKAYMDPERGPIKLIRASFQGVLPNRPLKLASLKNPGQTRRDVQDLPLFEIGMGDLIGEVRKAFADKTLIEESNLDPSAFNLYGDSGFAFLENMKNALGDNRDCLYSISSFDFGSKCAKQKRAYFFNIAADEFLVVAGVNQAHRKAATYTNLVLYEMQKHSPIASFDSTQERFQKSAEAFFPTALAPNYYAVIFAWDCTDLGPTCVEIKGNGVDLSTVPLILVERAYLNPISHTRPQPFVLSRMMKYRR